MQDYDFLNLSPIEFEDLTRDLLQVHLGFYLESFKAGKDKGIDMRFSHNQKNTLIIQCKRYSEYNSLLSNLKKEFEKVKVLNPQRYILVSSIAFSVANKDKIVSMFSPFIQSTSDIFGKNDLNNLLGQSPEIEKKYHKLWLSSVNMLQKILHGSIINRSDFLTENIEKNIKIFVQNNSFNEAVDILNETGFVILSGNPGVGKTTLAKMLVYELIAMDYEVIEVSADIEEAEKIFTSDKKQVFYYDDFLGSNFLEHKIIKNEDKRLYNFIEKIRNSSNKKLIMTTREYILNQAKQKFEILGRQDFDMGKYIIDLEKYSKLAKAEIFYNHLFFSNLGEEYISTILDNKKYIKIIEHTNYNPRVIELMTFRLNRKLISPENYYEKFIVNLENPAEIWKSAFENQISDVARYILYVLLITSSNITYDCLIESVKSIIKSDSQTYDISVGRNGILNAFKEIENTFIMISKGYNKEKNLISFQNPSVRDFMINYIRSNAELIETILRSVLYFNQLFTIIDTGKEPVDYFIFENEDSSKGQKIKLSNDLQKLVVELIIEKFYSLEFLGYLGSISGEKSIGQKLAYLDDYYDYKNIKLNKFIASVVENVIVGGLRGINKEKLVKIIREVKEYLKIEVFDFIGEYVDNIISINDVKALLRLKILYPDEYKSFKGSHNKDLIKKIETAIEEDILKIKKNDDDEINVLIRAIEELESEFSESWISYVEELNNMLVQNKKKEPESDRIISSNENAEVSNSEANERIERMFNSLVL